MANVPKDSGEKGNAGTERGGATPGPYFGSAREIVARYTHCAFCGANLHFTHVTDFSRNLTHESAKCPECGIQVRNMMHRLQ